MLELLAWDTNEAIARWGVGVLIFLSTTVVSYLLGRWWGAYQAKREWESREFLGRINVSLNSFRDGKLRIRTILERSLDEIFLNPVAVKKVRTLARLATKEQPILPIDKEDRWYLLNFVLNAVAERFATGVFRADAGVAVQKVMYLIFLTCEQDGDDRIRKVRALVVQETDLNDFPYADPSVTLHLEAAYHIDRVETIRKAAVLLKEQPDLFLKMEICL
jgi:hypothetical protein